MTLQERPVCFECHEVIEENSDLAFEAPCGHLDCPSVAFHMLHLMKFRERRPEWLRIAEQVKQAWLREHSEGDR